QAIYKGPQGEFNGFAGGVSKSRTGNSSIQVTKAKPGYAVGAIFARGGNGFDAFQPIYMKITPNGLDPNDSYKGPHIGGEGGGSGTVGGDGNFIVGIHGKLGDSTNKVEAISIITLTRGAAALTNPAPKRPTN